MRYVLPCSIALCETAILIVFFGRFLGTRYRLKLPYIICYSIFFIANSVVSICIPEYVALLTISAYFLISFTMYRGTVTQRLFCGGLLTAYIFVSENIVMVLLSYITNYPVTEIANHALLYYAGAYASKALLMLLAFVVSGRRKTRVKPAPFTYHLFLLIIIYICVGLSVADIVLVIKSGESATIIYALSEVAFMLLSVLVFFVFEKFQSYAEREAHTAVIEQQLAQNEQMFKLMERQNFEIRSIKHDIANHLTSINKLAASHKYEELQAYIQTYISESLNIVKKSATDNAVLDAMISEKCMRAEDQNIKFEVRADNLKDVRVDPVHLNVILSNALDNAIEACDAFSKVYDDADRYIKLGLKTEHNYLVMRIANSSLPIDIVDGGLPSTSKSDRLSHGFGLVAIQRIVERYGGVLVVEYEDGEFVLMAQIYNEKL